jgi:hypothetical protein
MLGTFSLSKRSQYGRGFIQCNETSIDIFVVLLGVFIYDEDVIRKAVGIKGE